MLKKINKNSLTLALNTTIYPLEAVYGASYVFIDKAYLFLDSNGSKIEVVLTPKQKLSAGELRVLAGDFLNELLNYALRVGISAENKKIRQYVVERALFSAANIESCDCEAKPVEIGFDSASDPLGIAVPWEEKYGQPEKQEEPEAKQEEKKPKKAKSKK